MKACRDDSVSLEWLSQYIYADKRYGGKLRKRWRCQKMSQKRYGSNDRRGKIANPVSITPRVSCTMSSVRPLLRRENDWGTMFNFIKIVFNEKLGV